MSPRVFRTILRSSVLALCTLITVSGQSAAKDDGSFHLIDASIDSIHAAMKSGKLTAHQLVQMYLDRIAAYNHQGPDINCIVNMNADALADADKLDAEFKKSGNFVGSMHGIPILVKDEIDTAGMPTTLGTIVFKDYRPPLDAYAVAEFRKQGAIILGKTTLSEFAAGDTYGSAFAERGEAFGVTRNPYDPTRTVGGSSGGSGACLAANFSTVTLGEETSASIRRPGAWNAVVSMRATSGLISRTGMYDGWPDEPAVMGPMAHDVADLAKMMDVMVGYDAEDPLSALGVGHKPASYTAGLSPAGLQGTRIGVLRTDIGQNTDPNSQDYKNVMAVFNQSVKELQSAGATVVDPIEIPGLVELQKIRGRAPGAGEKGLEIWLARNPNSQFKTRADIARSPDVDKIFPPTKAAQYKRTTEPADDPDRYGKYLIAREQLMQNFMKVLADNKLDAIVWRTVEHSPTLIADGIKPPYETNKGVPTLNTFLVYVPVIQVPAGFTSEHLPAGITFMGAPYSDARMIQLAYAYEQATHHRVPPASTPPLSAGH